MAIPTWLPLMVLPVLAIAGLGEALVWRRLGRGGYPWGEAAASIGVAVGQSVIRMLLRGLVLGLLFAVWQWRLWTVPLETVWGLALLFFAVEFVYYWHHRMHHRVRWFWATHAVHHSANQITFFAAIRLGWTAEVSLGFWPFLVLPLLGFHPLGVAGMLVLNLLFQFLLHTETVPRLGWLEGVVNTPAGHRVHHASNAVYLDRNFGGVLLVFDRIFGSWQPERDDTPCRYGLTTPITTHNPVRIALQEWSRLWRDVRAARGVRARLGVLIGPP